MGNMKAHGQVGYAMKHHIHAEAEHKVLEDMHEPRYRCEGGQVCEGVRTSLKRDHATCSAALSISFCFRRERGSRLPGRKAQKLRPCRGVRGVWSNRRCSLEAL